MLKNTKETNAKLYRFEVNRQPKKIAKKIMPLFFNLLFIIYYRIDTKWYQTRCLAKK